MNKKTIIIKKTIFWTPVILLVTLLSSCQSSKDPVIYSDGKVETLLSGRAIDGLILDGEINAYDINSDCSKAELIGSGKTDLEGKFQINVKHLPNEEKLVLFEIASGYYQEEATKERVDILPTQKLYGIDKIKFQEDTKISRTVSGFSHLLYKLTCYKANNEELTIDQAWFKSALQISLVVGGMDVMNTEYIDIWKSTTDNNTNGSLNFESNPNEIFYSFLVGSISHMVNDRNQVNGSNLKSINYFIGLGEDLAHDGVINGQSQNGFVGLGIEQLEPDDFRVITMRKAINLMENEKNALFDTDLKKNLFMERVNNIHSNSNSIYDYSSAVALDNIKPILDIGIKNRYLTNNIIKVTFNEPLKDLSISVYKDNVLIETEKYEDIRVPVNYSLNPNLYKTGVYRIELLASDFAENSSSKTLSFTKILDAPIVNFIDFPKITTGDFSIVGDYELIENDININSITAKWSGFNKGDFKWSKDDSQNKFVINVNIPRVGGIYDLTVEVCDTLNNCYSINNEILVDLNKPLISNERFNSEVKITNARHEIIKNSFLNVDFFNSLNNIHGFYVEQGKNLLNNQAITLSNLDTNKIPYIAMKLSDDSSDGLAKTSNDELTISIVYSKGTHVNGNLIVSEIKTSTGNLSEYSEIDNKKQYILPLTAEYLGNELANSKVDDIHVIALEVCDKVNLCSNRTYYFNYYYDNTIAVLTDTVPASGVAVLNYDITISTDEPLTSLTVSVINKDGNVVETKSYTDIEEEIVFSLTRSKYSSADYTFRMIATDRGNNQTEVNKTLTMVYEAPSITLADLPSLVNNDFTVDGGYSLVNNAIDIKSIKAKFSDQNNVMTAILNKTGKTFSFNAVIPKIGGNYDLEITACDTLNNCYSINNEILVDLNKPLISNERFNSEVKITNARHEIIKNSFLNVDFFNSLNNIHGFYVEQGKNLLNNQAITLSNLDTNKIPYIAMKLSDDLSDGLAKTSNDELTISIVYSKGTHVNGNLIVSEIKTSTGNLSEYSEIDNKKQYILPLTAEYLGNELANSKVDDIHVIALEVCDKVNLCSNRTYYFNYYYDNTIAVLTDTVPASGVAVLNYDITISTDEPLTSLTVSVINKDGDVVETKSYTDIEEEIVFSLTRSKYSSADYTFRMIATDRGNNQTEVNKTLTMVNEAPSITLADLPSLVNNDFTVDGGYSLVNNAIDIKSIKAKFSGQNNVMTAILNKTGKTFSFNVIIPKIGGNYDLEITACDVLDKCQTTKQSIAIDKNAPVVSYVEINDKINYYMNGNNRIQKLSNLGSDWFVSNLSRGFLVEPHKQTLNSLDKTIRVLKNNGIAYISFRIKDYLGDGGSLTSNDELKINMTYSTAQTSIGTLNKSLVSTNVETLFSYANLSDGTKQYILPLTTEYLGNSFYQESSTNTIHVVDFSICDKANNCKQQSFYFLYRLDVDQTPTLLQTKPVRKDYDSQWERKSKWNDFFPLVTYQYTNNNNIDVNFFYRVLSKNLKVERSYIERSNFIKEYTYDVIRYEYGITHHYQDCRKGSNYYFFFTKHKGLKGYYSRNFPYDYSDGRCSYSLPEGDRGTKDIYNMYFSKDTVTSSDNKVVTSSNKSSIHGNFVYSRAPNHDVYQETEGHEKIIVGEKGEIIATNSGSFKKVMLKQNETIYLTLNNQFPNFNFYENSKALQDSDPVVGTLKDDSKLKLTATYNLESYVSIDTIQPLNLTTKNINETIEISK